MTEVFVVTEGWEYEGERVIGAYSSSEKAGDFAKKYHTKNRSDDVFVYKIKLDCEGDDGEEVLEL